VRNTERPRGRLRGRAADIVVLRFLEADAQGTGKVERVREGVKRSGPAYRRELSFQEARMP
jgi:hypothetical protein